MDVSKQLQAALDSPAVRAALVAKAARMLPRAQRLAAEAGALGTAKALRVLEGTRPGSKARGGMRRPYARIQVDLTEDVIARDARARLTRTQILRRAARA